MINKDKDFFYTDDIKDTKLETRYKKRVIDNVAYKKIDQDDFLNLSISTKKLNIIIILVLLVMSIMVGRIFYLQIIKGSYYKEVAEGNRIRVETTKAARGLIYDRNGNLLVKNIPNFTLTITKGDLPEEENEQEEIFNSLSQVLEIDKQEIKNKVEESSLWKETVIADYISYEQGLELIILSSKLPGVNCRAVAIREYIEPEILSHVVGYLGRINEQELEEYQDQDYLSNDYIGKSSLESFYEKILKGKDGKKQIEVNSQGQEIKIIAEEQTQAGDNLYLSLDLDLQKKAYAAMEKYIKLRNSKSGTLIALDPRDGSVLALVSWPGFDSNEFVQGIKYEDYQQLLEDESNPLFNKAISGEYPSGSTFKPVVAAAALQEKVVNEGTTVNSTGGIEINQWYFPDWKEGGHGTSNLIKALAESVNTYFYIAGGGVYNLETNEIEGGLGINRINKYARLFGLNQKTGIDLSGERAGFLPTKEWKEEFKQEVWYIGDTYHVAIGQGDILVTPLQVANFTTVIANGGTLYKPHLLNKKTNPDNEETDQVIPQILNSGFMSKYNIEIVQTGMRDAVIYGSAKALNSLPVAVAAKTGTAQHSGEGENHSWLTSFAPYNSPEIVVTALVEEGGEGTEAALPVVNEVLSWYFSNK